MKMGEQDDGLSLTLTLKCAASDAAASDAANHDHNNNNNNNLPPPPVAVAVPAPALAAFPFGLVPSPYNFLHHLHHQRPGPTNFISPALPSPADLNAEMRSYLRRLDENRFSAAAAAAAVAAADGEEEEEEVVVSSPNSTVSTTSLSGGKRGERDYDAERDSSSQYGVASEDDDGGDAAARKKLRLSKDQAAVLEETFKEHSTLNPKQKLALAKQLDLRPRQVEVWFQNRRARTKLKQTEVDCEYLKRCCETLTEENRRLQKEVNELRALKLSPQFYMNMNPPTTLTMCPQCERVAVSSSSSSSTVVGSSGARTTGVASTRHPNPAGPHRPKPMPANSWAKIISPQTLNAHRPQ